MQSLRKSLTLGTASHRRANGWPSGDDAWLDELHASCTTWPDPNRPDPAGGFGPRLERLETITASSCETARSCGRSTGTTTDRARPPQCEMIAHGQTRGQVQMSARFEEIDRRRTPIGEISLRRRQEPTLGVDVYEVKLDDEFLMSSLFTVAEIELATRGLAEIVGDDLDVVVGGLGLGYTARAVLDDPRVRSLHVVETLKEVIEWHERQLLPLSAALTSDPRCHLVHGDFFAMVAGGAGFGPGAPHRSHGVFVDIDHTPRHVLHPRHARFYEPDGLRDLVRLVHPSGVFALWSDDPPDEAFIATTREVFASCEAHVVAFPNFYTSGESANTVYIARVGDT